MSLLWCQLLRKGPWMFAWKSGPLADTLVYLLPIRWVDSLRHEQLTLTFQYTRALVFLHSSSSRWKPIPSSITWCVQFPTLNVHRLSQQVRGSPMYKVAQCLAVHSPDLPKRLRKDIIRSKYSDKALRSAEKQLFTDTGFKARVSTIQAIDMVQGGVKVNALPEQAWAVINHRISTERRVIITIRIHDCLTLTNQALWTKPDPTSSICSSPSPMLSTYHTLHSVLVSLIQRLLCMVI